MEERSNEMMEELLKIGVGKNPIVWVGHSKGGLFAKQMIVDGMLYIVFNNTYTNIHILILLLQIQIEYSILI